jgi:hypothetical protein
MRFLILLGLLALARAQVSTVGITSVPFSVPSATSGQDFTSIVVCASVTVVLYPGAPNASGEWAASADPSGELSGQSADIHLCRFRLSRDPRIPPEYSTRRRPAMPNAMP